MTRFPSLFLMLSPHEARLYRIEEETVTFLDSVTEEKNTFSDHEGSFGAGGASEPDVMNTVRKTHEHHHVREAMQYVARQWQEAAFHHLVVAVPERLKNVFHDELKRVLPQVEAREVYGNYSHADESQICELFEKSFELPE